jgi:hypothetical protein
MKRKHSEYRLRDGDQIPTRLVTIREIMSDPKFACGVTDVRAGRGYPTDYNEWKRHQWSYERGRFWGLLVPRNVVLKRDGKVTDEAIEWYQKIGDAIP